MTPTQIEHRILAALQKKQRDCDLIVAVKDQQIAALQSKLAILATEMTRLMASRSGKKTPLDRMAASMKLPS